MTTIPEHVKNLLFEQDCVVIPDFGGFIGNFDSATFLQDGQVLPPRKRLVFNEMLQFDDGLLSSYVATAEHRSREEVKTRLRAFVEHVRSEIRQKEHYRFDQLGMFTLNSEGKLVFAPEGKINFHGDSFGMPELTPAFVRQTRIAPVARPAVLEPEIEEVEQEAVIRPLPTRRKWLSWTAASLVVVVLGIWFTGRTTTLSSMNPFSVFDFSWAAKKKAAAPVVAPKVEKARPKAIVAPKPTESATAKFEAPVAEVPKAPEIKEEIVENHTKFLVVPSRVKFVESDAAVEKGYYIVAGSFGGVKYANRMKTQLEKDGYAVRLIKPRTKGLVKVIIGEKLTSAEAAQRAAQKLGTHFHNNLWILKSVGE
ncbi:HU domain-containing protein [Siphonobacter aquaeclarae]|uniref:Sporulation related domain-containing protein n=1 Tax=Siphonobacter aquaeclarae TaxID=563176 RepID=A0A1G9RNR6_9BACT|nr:SPOR domain-containing protein [Siphonobacter aquaeclarae]SDM24928.1 Sporulation related domain-containing protein [Siphonobacter aquaeclarae]